MHECIYKGFKAFKAFAELSRKHPKEPAQFWRNVFSMDDTKMK